MQFNTHLSLGENIKLGLWARDKSIYVLAKDLGTTENTVKTIISERFTRKEKMPPMHKKVFEYLSLHCTGFKEWAEEKNITIDS
jgi:hypothetical protein